MQLSEKAIAGATNTHAAPFVKTVPCATAPAALNVRYGGLGVTARLPAAAPPTCAAPGPLGAPETRAARASLQCSRWRHEPVYSALLLQELCRVCRLRLRGGSAACAGCEPPVLGRWSDVVRGRDGVRGRRRLCQPAGRAAGKDSADDTPLQRERTRRCLRERTRRCLS